MAVLKAVPDIETVRYAREAFPSSSQSSFRILFDAHGIEVRGKPFELDFQRYHELEMRGRLVWIVARTVDSGVPLGYACGFTYRDLHFDELVAADDLWFVIGKFRRSGIGRTVKAMCHACLVANGARRVYDSIRGAYSHPTLMHELGFEKWGVRWVKIF